MKFFIFSGILLIVLSSASGLADGDEAVTSVKPPTRGNRKRRFIGSENTEVTFFPYHVSLEYKTQTTCSGAIISAHFVLTAANCRVNDEKNLIIRAGSNLRGIGGTIHHVDKFITHPNFTSNPRDGHDIALVRGREAFVADNYHKRIEMLRAGEEIRLGSMVDICGFSKAANQLQHIAVPVAPCDKKDIFIAPDTFCAGYYEQNICIGDTGSPVTNGLQLVGIVSYESNCGKSPGIITKVAHFHDWISKIIYSS